MASSCIGHLGGIPAAIENERFLQPRRSDKNKMVRISGALRIWRSNYRHCGNPGQAFRAGVWGTLPGLPRNFPRERHAGRKARNSEETECGNRNQLARASSRCVGRSRSGIGKRWPGCFRANRLEAPSPLQLCFRVSGSKSGLARAGHPDLADLEKAPLPLAIFPKGSHPLFDPAFRLFRPFRPQYPIFLAA